MQILYFVPYPPSLIRVRPYQLIRMLARRGHAVTVVAPWSTERDREDLRGLEGRNITVLTNHLPRWRSLWNCLRAIPTRLPFQAAFSWDPGLLQVAAAALKEREFDLVHVEHLRGALFGLELARMKMRPGKGRSESIPVVWDSVDCITRLFEQASVRSKSARGRWMARLDLARTRRFESRLAERFDHVLVTSEADREALLSLPAAPARGEETREPGSSTTQVSVVPNGVDLHYFTPPATPREPATLVFSGKMSYHANVTAAHFLVNDVMPLVWKQRPDARVVLAGKNPPKSLLELATVESNRGSDAEPPTSASDRQVEVTGSLPDLRPCLRSATLALVPIVYGAGIQNKVLEAMACATPVIATPAAVSSLSVRSGRDLDVAADADEFARNILGLLDDGERRNALGRAGRAFVESHHDWDTIGERLEAIYSKAVQAGDAQSIPNSTLPVMGLAQVQ